MFRLSTKQIAEFLDMGIRPSEVVQPREGDVDNAYLLIPTCRGEWLREHAKQIKSTWEGSYIPLIIYRQKAAVILVDYKEVEQWETLRAKIETILKMPTTTRGD